MIVRYRHLLAPFRRGSREYLAGMLLRQGLLVFGGYTLVWVLHASLVHVTIPAWIFVSGLLLYDTVLVRLDATLNQAFASRVSFPMFRFLRTRALAKFFSMPLEWHQRNHSGVLAGKVNNGVGRVVQTAEAVSRELGPAVLRTGLSLAPLIYFSPMILPFLVLAIVAFVWCTVIENRLREPFRKARHSNYARDFGMFSECLDSVHPVVLFGQAGAILNRYDTLQHEIEQQGVTETGIAARYGARRNLLLSAAKRCCQGVWLWQYRKGTLDAALVMYLSAVLEDLLNSLGGYAGLFERVFDGIEPASDLIQLLDESSSMQSNPNAPTVQVPAVVEVELRKVDFAYPNGAEVLRDFSLRIEPGCVLGIVGRSGVGKTTLNHLLPRTYDPRQGAVLVAGTDAREWPADQLRGLFSCVSQNGGVFFSDTSILDAIRFPRPDASVEEVIEAAQCACIHAEILEMPDEYRTRLGQRGLTLSAGQRQRLALAQALIALQDRKVLILDEFTSALDARTEQQILINLAPLIRDKTVIVIAHRLATLRKIADQIIVLDRSGIAESGDHSELIRRNGLYAELARLQATA